MKILFLSDDFPPDSFGGAGIVAYNLAKQFQLDGNEVFIITTVRKRASEGEINLEGLNIFKIYSNYHERWRAWLSLYNLQTICKVKAIIKKINPDVVHAHNIHYYLSYHTLKLAKKYSKSVFLTAHDVMLIHYGKLMPKNGAIYYKITAKDQIKEARKRYNPFRNLFIRHYLRYADKIFAVSNALKKVLEINGIKNIETIYNGIDVSDWDTKLSEIESFRRKNNLIDKKIILFGGRISEAKGSDVMLRAMKLVIKEIDNAILLIVGKNDFYFSKMVNLSKKLNINENIKFLGWLDRKEMGKVYNLSNICVTPSIYLDPFPTVNLEAMINKIPVIGTCFGGTPEIVINNQTGYIVDPSNTKELSDKIIDLLKNPQKAKQFGEAGYKRVKDFFYLQEQARKILENYKKYI